MAGPTPMALGDFQFEGLGFGFDSQDRSTNTPWAIQNTAHRLDAQQWTGPTDVAFEIRGVLFPHRFGGLSTLEGLRRAALKGRALMLVTRAGNIHGMHTIQAINEGRSIINASGLPHKCEYTISLLKYDQGGTGGIDALVSFI